MNNGTSQDHKRKICKNVTSNKRGKKEQKTVLESQFDVSIIESHPDGLKCTESPKPQHMQNSVSSLFKWCEWHFK